MKAKSVLGWVGIGILGLALWLAAHWYIYVMEIGVSEFVEWKRGLLTARGEEVSKLWRAYPLMAVLPSLVIVVCCLGAGLLERRGVRVSKTGFLAVLTALVMTVTVYCVAALVGAMMWWPPATSP